MAREFWKTGQGWGVYLYVPNLIGYVRLLLLVPLVACPLGRPGANAVAYGVSQVLDFLDGAAARGLGQCSKFGEVLDMVTDRVSDALMFAVLGWLYPEQGLLFGVALALDLASHWFQMSAALLLGASHKALPEKYRLLRLYYSNAYYFMDVLILGSELFLIFLYCGYFYSGLYSAAVLMLPFCLAKQVVSLVQLASAAERLAAGNDISHIFRF
jgi:CDP-diacylglycerol--inositol 3-phosphatidyltransferase